MHFESYPIYKLKLLHEDSQRKTQKKHKTLFKICEALLNFEKFSEILIN